MYYSAIGMLALLILLIENQDVLRNINGAFEKPAWKVYRRFLFAVLAYYITDILWGIIESLKLPGLLFADTTAYYITMGIGVLYWVEYTVSYLDDKNMFGKTLIYAGRALALVISLLSLINIFKPVLFTVDEACAYTALPIRYVVLIMQIFLLLLISIFAYTFILRNDAMKRKGQALALFGLTMALFLFLQLLYQYLPLYSIAYMLGTCLLHTMILNEEKEEYRRGMEEASEVSKLKDNIVALLDNMPGMTFTKDAETGVYLACNQAFADYAHKSSPEGVVGLTDEQIFDPETAKHFVEDDKMALSMDKPFIFFEDVPDAAGNQKQLQTTKLKYYDFDGRLCVLGICRDVSEMVRIQRSSTKTKEDYEEERNTGIIYANIAQALARGYTDLYYIDTDTEGFIEYRSDDEGRLKEVRRGWHFFEECKIKAEQLIYPDDKDKVINALNRRNLLTALDKNSSFVMTYRLISDEGPHYVSMKVSRREDDDHNIVLGVTDVDEEMKQRQAAERVKEEHIAYTRLNALTGDFLCVYVMDPKSGRYREFSATEDYNLYAQAKEGIDFFEAISEAATEFVHPEDLNRFLSAFTKENVISEIEKHGFFTISYRLMMNGKPVYVQLKAAKVQEKEGERLVFGINDIDSQVRQEEDYVKNLAKAKIEANIDALTGVKNRHAYLMAEERLNVQIKDHKDLEFAVVILDVNDLKKINDTEGHNTGDQYIKDACRIICEIFKHSPVFRVGGDEFVVITQGSDYNCIDELINRVYEHNMKAKENGGIVIACGMAKHQDESIVAPVFERADQNMYDNKYDLKSDN